jgi:hypothetical protein
MDDVIETLWNACGKLAFAPMRPFPTVFDFEAYVLQRFPARSEEEKKQQLAFVLKAVRAAEAHREAEVVECLKRVRELSLPPV